MGCSFNYKIFKLQKWALMTSAFKIMYMIHLSSTLACLWINITQISFHHFFSTYLLKIFKHIITQQEMPQVTVSIKRRKCFLIVQLEIVDLLPRIPWTKL